jgi:CheY-like chemotaxis protein
MILIVEDDVPLRETFQDVLRQSGYRVMAAEDAPAALALIRERRPSFMFVDLILRGMSGRDLIRTMKGDPALASIPVVAMTASWNLEADGVAVMKKPFTTQAAIDLIENHCGNAR